MADSEPIAESPSDAADEIAELRARLAAAEAAALEKTREMERFTYIVSHDLRSPLLTIQGFADILRMDVADGNKEALEEDLAHILQATGKMRLLLDDLLELSRIGRFAEPPSEVDLTTLARDGLAELDALREKKNAEVEIEDLPTLPVDRSRIQQVFRVLLDNGIRYGEAGRAPKVQVGCRETDDGVEIFVRDDGVGLAPEHLKQAFRPFERFSADSEGSGMGLALAHRIVVDYHSGSIRAESAGAGQGTTIYFTLGEPTAEPG